MQFKVLRNICLAIYESTFFKAQIKINIQQFHKTYSTCQEKKMYKRKSYLPLGGKHCKSIVRLNIQI